MDATKRLTIAGASVDIIILFLALFPFLSTYPCRHDEQPSSQAAQTDQEVLGNGVQRGEG